MNTEAIVFYLDDDQEDLLFFKDAASLVAKEVKVKTRTNSDELLHDLQNPPPVPSAIFLDINMPKRNGLDVLTSIRNKSEFDHIPVIIFTTSNSPDVIDKSKQLGANLFITKPTNFSDLKKAIRYTLDLDWKTLVQDQFLYRVN